MRSQDGIFAVDCETIDASAMSTGTWVGVFEDWKVTEFSFSFSLYIRNVELHGCGLQETCNQCNRLFLRGFPHWFVNNNNNNNNN